MEETDRWHEEVERLFLTDRERLGNSLVEGDLIPVLKQRGIEVKSTARRMKGRLDGRPYEIEIMAGNASELVLVEVRTRLRSSDIKRFLYKVSRLCASSGVCRGRRVYGAVACSRSTRAVRAQAERRGLFVIRATGSSASIVNGSDFKPRVFS
ncbi:MAG: hypothetical protein OXI49_18630 [Acidobacteriota bacterium]|nr:hypothetical protein [Acidobacteriota bacterium]